MDALEEKFANAIKNSKSLKKSLFPAYKSTVLEIKTANKELYELYLKESYKDIFPNYDKDTSQIYDSKFLEKELYLIHSIGGLNKDLSKGAAYKIVKGPDYCQYFKSIDLIEEDYIDIENNPVKILTKDVKNFCHNKKLFKDLNCHYKRGALLYGPPGNGKSREILRAIRYFTKYYEDGLAIFMQERDDVELLKEIKQHYRDTPIMVIFEELTNFKNSNLMLNFLDGSESVDNCYFIATTNNPSELEANLVNRPGRFDTLINVPNPDSKLQKLFLSKFFKEEEINKIIDRLNNFSIAHLKEIIIYSKLNQVSLDNSINKIKSQIDLVNRNFVEIKASQGNYA